MPRTRAGLTLAAAGLTAALIAAVTVGVSAAANVATEGVAEPGLAELAELSELMEPFEPAVADPSEPPTKVPADPTAQEVTEAPGSSVPVGEEEPSTPEEQDQPVAPVTPAADQDPPATPLPGADPIKYDASTDIATIPRPPAGWSASELANAEVWLTQQSIVADCMLDKGFDYVFTPWWMFPPKYNPGSENWDGDFSSPKGIALDGEPDRGLGEDYDWREAGCHGYAVHVTGMDNAN